MIPTFSRIPIDEEFTIQKGGTSSLKWVVFSGRSPYSNGILSYSKAFIMFIFARPYGRAQAFQEPPPPAPSCKLNGVVPINGLTKMR